MAILRYRFLSDDFCLHVLLTVVWPKSNGSQIVVPGPNSISLTWRGGYLLGMQILRFHPRPAESEIQGTGYLSRMGFNKFSCRLKFITSVKGKWANNCQGPQCDY